MKISIRGLSFGFGKRQIFNDLSLEISASPSLFPVVILGPSGSGKTTLLRLIAGLVKSGEGEIVYEGFDAAGESYSGGERAGKSSPVPPVSFVFQENRLLPYLPAAGNVSLPVEKLYGKEKARLLSVEYLKAAGLEERKDSMPDELSGGEKQRVSLARAFAYPSRLLLMDEPFQSLDIPLRLSLMDLTLSLLKDGATYSAQEHGMENSADRLNNNPAGISGQRPEIVKGKYVARKKNTLVTISEQMPETIKEKHIERQKNKLVSISERSSEILKERFVERQKNNLVSISGQRSEIVKGRKLELCSSFLTRLAIAVTHDPREAVYMGSRVIVLGKPPRGIVFDKKIELEKEDRAIGSQAAISLEKELLASLMS